jgi:hypothetical protein
MVITYHFTLRFKLDEPDKEPSNYLDELQAKSSEEISIETVKKGSISFNFVRSASSVREAMLGAIEHVKKAIPKAVLVEVSPDLVGLTDAAKAISCSRQNMRSLLVNSKTPIPQPIYEGTSSLWHLADLLAWLKAEKMYELDPAMYEVTIFAMELNAAIAWQKISPKRHEDLRAILNFLV